MSLPSGPSPSLWVEYALNLLPSFAISLLPCQSFASPEGFTLPSAGLPIYLLSSEDNLLNFFSISSSYGYSLPVCTAAL